MSADELRARFSDLAERVVPMEDPHGRLMSRRRKRFRARIASLATVTAAVLAGGVAAPSTLLSFGTRPELGPDVVAQPTETVTAAEYLDRLVKAPVRGNLSGKKDLVADVEKAFVQFVPAYEGAKEPRLVFLNQTDQMLQAVVIYTGGEKPIAVARGARSDGSVKDLLSDAYGSYQTPLSPFLVIPIPDYYGKAKNVVGLAPPGCSIEHSAKGVFAPDGSWVRSYEPEPTGDYIVRDRHLVNELWRVSCDGRVREVRIADDYLDSSGVEGNASAMYERTMRFSGAAPNKSTIQWSGRIPGFKSDATLVSPRSLPGPAMMAVGPFPKAILATDLLDKEPMPTASGSREEWSMIALGIAGEGVTVVRMPQMFGDRTVLGDQVFVYTDTAAARVEALDAKLNVVSGALVKNGVAILTFSPGLADEIRAVTSRGSETSSVRFIELAKGSRVLGDQLFKDW